MALKATAKAPGSGGNYEVPEAGNQPAVLVAIIDLGTHANEYDGKKYDSHRVQLVWELVNQEKADGKNHVIGREYTLSISENSNLGKLVTALTGKKFVEGEDFDVTQLLGKPCLVNIVHGKSQKGNVFAKVEGASMIPKGKGGKPMVEVPAPSYKPIVWEIENSTQLPEHLTWLPYIIGEPPLEVIRRSKEWKEKLAAGHAKAATFDPDEGEIGEESDPAF